MAGDVRAGFDLNERPATEALRRVEREGARADATMERLGQTIDSTFTARNREQVRAYERDLRSYDRTAVRTMANTRREWRSTEREVLSSVAKQETAITSLEGSLRSLGTVDARPNVNLHGFAEANAQIDLLEARLRALGAINARPGVSLPTTRLAAQAAVPGGGGSAFGGGRGLRIPFAGSVPWPLVGAALGAAPPLVGGATGLLGSASSGLLGAGALGLTAGGVGAAAGGMALPTTIVAAHGIKEASKALGEYQEQVIQTGPHSKEAREALREFNAALREAPGGTRRFLRQRELLGQEFTRATRPAQADVAGIGTRGINLGRQLTPQFGRLANDFFGEARVQTDQFADFAANDRSRAFYEAMGREATADLTFLESTSENVLATMENIARAGRPFFHEGVVFLEDWTGGWRDSTNDIKDTRGEIGEMVGDLKAWGRLAGATFRLTRDLLSPARQPGTSMVDDLTQQLNEWDRWVKRNPAQVRAFFRDSVEGTEKIASALGNITQMLWKLGQQLAPLLEQGAQFVTLLSNAGLLTPGGLPLLLGAGAGARNVFGAGRGGGRGGAAAGGVGAAPLIIGGGAGGVGGSTRGALGRIGGAIRSPGYGYSYSTIEGQSAWSRNSRVGAGLRATGAELGPAAGRFGRGFARSFGPYALLSAGLGAAGTEGDIWERLLGGISQASLGLVAPPKSQAQELDAGMQEAARVSAALAGRFGEDPRGLTAQIQALRRRRGEALTPEPAGGLTGFLTTSAVPSIDLGRSSFGLPTVDRVGFDRPKSVSEEARQTAKGFTSQIGSLREQRSALVSGTALGEIQNVFGIRTRHGEDPRQAFEKAADSIESRAGRMKGRTSREFSQMSLNWARAMARSDPKLKGTVDDLASSIERRLNRMGENVRVIHGRIVDVSAKSWSNVADLISTQTQRAYSEANENLTALEKRAMAILHEMGYSPGEAKRLTMLAQKGPQGQRLAGMAAQSGPLPPGAKGPEISDIRPGKFREHATGGRLPMPASGSLHDVLDLGGGHKAAGGEVLIGNRHTERKVDRLLAPFGTTLAREIGREGRAHSQPFREYNAATGSIFPAARLAQGMGLSVSGGPGFGGIPSSGHASGSLHYSGLAYDVSGPAALMRQYRIAAERRFTGHGLNELFYDPFPYYIDEGHKVPGAIGGHSDHVHIGFFPSGAQLAGGRGMGRLLRGGRGGMHQQVNLHGRQSKLGGIPGAASTRSNEMIAVGLSQNLNRLIGAGGGRGGGRGGGGALGRFNRVFPEGSLADPGMQLSSEVVRRIATAAGLPGRLFEQIAHGESNYYPGIVGHDPGGTEGLGLWQITTGYNDALIRRLGGRRAMLNPVINARAAKSIYDSSGIGAWYGTQFVTSGRGHALGGRIPGFAGWYAKGGHFRVKNPTMFGVGENGAEDVSITPVGRRRGGGHGDRPIQVRVDMRGAQIHGQDGADKVARRVGRKIAEELADAMASSDSVTETSLNG